MLSHFGWLIWQTSAMVQPSDGQPRKSLGKRLVGPTLRIGFIVFVFGILLPRVVDYGEVWDAITGLTLRELAVLLALSVLRVISEAVIYRSLLPGLRIPPGTEAFLSQNFVGSFTPGPTSTFVQYAYFRSQGFAQQIALTGAIGTFIFPTAGRMVLPITGFILLVASGEASVEALIFAGIALILLALVCVCVWYIGRSDSSARWAGERAEAGISWVLRKLGKDPVTGLGDRMVQIKNETYGVVGKRWRVGTVAVAVNLLVSWAMFLAAVRFVGLSSDEISWAAVFAVFSLAFLSGVILPITGSGLGTVDAVMISLLSTLTGESSLAASGTFLWRAFYSFVTLPIGAVTFGRFSRTHAHLLSDASSALAPGARQPNLDEDAQSSQA